MAVELAQATPELAAALAAVEEPKSHLIEVRDESRLGRLYATPAMHRMVPAPVAMKLAEWCGRLEWRLSRTRRMEALHRAASVLGTSTDSSAARRLARLDLIERRALEELFWRPWRKRRLRIEGLEHLVGARAGGRGVILVTAHIGSVGGLLLGLADRGFKPYMALTRPVEAARIQRGRNGRAAFESLRWWEEAGCRTVGRGGSYPVFRALLARGEICLMAFDMPGSTPTTLGGRPVLLTSGISSLARDTNAALVCGFAPRDGHRARARLLAPVEPAAFPTTRALHEHLAEIVGEALFAHPEQASPQIARLHAHAESVRTGSEAPGARCSARASE